MGAVFFGLHAAIADFEHVGIVPVARAGEGRKTCLGEADCCHGGVVVFDVAGGAPRVAADDGSPAPDRLPAILAERVERWAGRCGQVRRAW